ncbi:hypothetical protein D3C86_459560 [compost metagenome]
MALLLGTLVTLTGCAPALPPSATEAQADGKISLFPNRNGMGSIAVRVVDQRKGYGTQAFWDADDFDKVRIGVSSAKMLKQMRVDTVAGNRQLDTYSTDALKALPPSDDYRVLVALTSEGTVVAQGAVTGIHLFPGQVTPVTVYINSVGESYFDSTEYEVRGELPGLPDYFQGLMEGSTVSFEVEFPWDPASPTDQKVTEVALDIFDDETQEILVSSASARATVVASANEPESPRVGVIDLTFPMLPGNEPWRLYQGRIYGLNSNSQVITTKNGRHPFYLLKGASITVELQ